MYNMGRNAAERNTAERKAAERKTAERNTAGTNAVEVTHVVHRFSEKTVLDDVSYQVASGEIFGLLGPSGAGKTTLIKILTGQLKQTKGRAAILGCDSAKLDGATYRKIGMMLDNFGLYERLSGYENLRLYAKLYEIPQSRVDDVLRRVGLWESRKLPVLKYSKGMRGRLLLARAVMNAPEILFLDEPTSGLDPATAAQIHRLMKEEQKRGATVFLTTHNMAEAQKLCDNIALLNEGRIVEYGSPEQICAKYNHQNRLKITLCDGRCVELSNDGSAAAALTEYLEQERIKSIHSTEPNLETVFMELTGRKFE